MPRIVLDTNIVRSLGAGELEPDTFQLALESGLSVHLAGPAISEIVVALSERRIPWDHWLRAREVLQNILKRPQPILVGGQEGLQMHGFPVRNIRTSAEMSELQALLLASWRILRNANSFDDLFRIQAQSGSGTVSLDPELIGRVASEFRAEWASEIDGFFEQAMRVAPMIQEELHPRADSLEAVEAFVSTVRPILDEGQEAPLPSLRLDAFLRVHALVLLRRTRKKNQYNTTKRKNDSYDHDLLKFLAFPAVLCTNDGPLIASVHTAGSWQERWIVRPEALRNVSPRPPPS